MFSLLRGMFALAIWDAPRRAMILARDRLGQKPLVYRHDGRRLVFASELKALLVLPESEMPRQIDPLALDHYLCYGYVPAPRTILEGTHKLPPAHYAVWHDSAAAIEPYWTQLERRADQHHRGRHRRAARRSAKPSTKMIADVPLDGISCQGGIDSTIIVGLMQQASSRPVKTFAIGFPDPKYDETRYAQIAADFLGTEHHTFVVEPKAWKPCQQQPSTLTNRSPTARPCPPGTSLTRDHRSVTVAEPAMPATSCLAVTNGIGPWP